MILLLLLGALGRVATVTVQFMGEEINKQTVEMEFILNYFVQVIMIFIMDSSAGHFLHETIEWFGLYEKQQILTFVGLQPRNVIAGKGTIIKVIAKFVSFVRGQLKCRFTLGEVPGKVQYRSVLTLIP